MKVTQVALRATDASNSAGRPSLTPELLAASGARYSRNNDGLESILSKIDPENLDKSVDSIFRMIDYGHQSIADMAPVAMFIDGISLWLAYYIWTLCPTAGGQESSTRYIKLSADELISPDLLGIPAAEQPQWRELMDCCFKAYTDALEFWQGIFDSDPLVAKIPKLLIENTSDKSQKTVARMRRNYGFDRSRYFLPIAAATNMMMVMSARGWVQLCQYLLSHPLPEANRVGSAIRSELDLSTPRLTRHADRQQSYIDGLRSEFYQWVQLANSELPTGLEDSANDIECPASPDLWICPPDGIGDADLAEDMRFHTNRYAYFGENLGRTVVRFGWQAVAMAEIRDLNRHRTGHKYCPLVPRGFYHAVEQLPADKLGIGSAFLRELGEVGKSASFLALKYLRASDASYPYWSLLGTQYRFQHTTSADKFIYEAELRTGTGAHFRYAKHFRDVVAELGQQFPLLTDKVQLGSAEPE